MFNISEYNMCTGISPSLSIFLFNMYVILLHIALGQIYHKFIKFTSLLDIAVNIDEFVEKRSSGYKF